MSLSRRTLLASAAATAVLAQPIARASAAGLPPITVWKAANCGCCVHWVEHLQGAGFTTEVIEVSDMEPVKARFGITADLASCHTGQVEGYFVEGHVPAGAIKRLLAERPSAARGLAVPGMPAGSPGMETGIKMPYDVLLLTAAGPSVYERH